MLFSSITFLFLFLPVTVLIYYLVPQKTRNLVLLIASLFFYAWGEPVYVVLMILSILLNFFCGKDIGKKRADPVWAKRSLIFAVVMNVLILGFFKYYGLLMETLNVLFPYEIPYRELALPIGISFYTFQELSYLIDIYRGNAKPQQRLLPFALYISMFPQLIAGPIVRYVDIEAQLLNRVMSMRKFGQGVMYFIVGFAKKVVLADSIGVLYEQITALPIGSFSVLTAWVGCLAFAFQIYFDFSGYSDMAIGLGKMFGFEFRKNFQYPYIAKNIGEFWRRWHISLGTWFREYVYIPLGGNKCPASRHLLNLLIVWALTGLWHGAQWNFLVWGLYYGVILILERYVWGRALGRLPAFVQHIYTFVLVLIGWVFFFSPSLGAAMDYLGVMFGAGASAWIDRQGFYFLLTHWLLFLLCAIGSSLRGMNILRLLTGSYESRRIRQIAACVVYIGMFLVSLAFLVTESFHPFLYFRF